MEVGRAGIPRVPHAGEDLASGERFAAGEGETPRLEVAEGEAQPVGEADDHGVP